ncbi:MAG: MATE family efflux transporter [Aquificae bacterium]|nr:MATE family efflux transporter [Aquificota bacterium]
MKRVIVSPTEPTFSVIRKVVKLATPVVIVNLLYTVENMISLLLVSGISPSAVAATGFSLSLLWFVYSLMALSYSGTNILVAQFVGARRNPAPVLTAGLILSFLISLPLFFRGKDLVLFIMARLGASQTVQSLASEYLTPIFWFIPIGFLTNTFYGAYNGSGDTKTPMKVALIMNAVHVSSAYSLIYGRFGLPELGVAGAGWGIALSESVAFLIYLYLLAFHRRPFPFYPSLKREVFLKIVRLGLPTALERAVTTLSFNVFVGFLARFGDEVLAAHQIGLRVESVSFMIGFGIMVATTTIAGQNYGAKNYEGLVRAVKISASFTALVMGFMGLLLILFPHYLVLPFSRDPQVVKLASYYLQIVGISQPAMAFASIFSGALKGMGRTTIPLVVNISSFWLFRIIPSYLLLKVFYTPLVPWLLMTAETGIRALFYFFMFRRVARSILKGSEEEKKARQKNAQGYYPLHSPSSESSGELQAEKDAKGNPDKGHHKEL